MSGYESEQDEQYPEVRELSKAQRRVLGVLVEKAFTTPEYYPLTIKAATAGCNQKSNRDPVTNYPEDSVHDTLESLRPLGLAAVVHTESGRTERYRHYARKRFPFTEPQLAIVTELLLRGRQQLGELRGRASRMVPIESLDQLRQELTGLLELGYIQASGPLERRGVEVDHNFYPASENKQLAQMAGGGDDEEESSSIAADRPSRPVVAVGDDVRNELAALRQENRELRGELESLRQVVDVVRDHVDELRRSLGV